MRFLKYLKGSVKLLLSPILFYAMLCVAFIWCMLFEDDFEEEMGMSMEEYSLAEYTAEECPGKARRIIHEEQVEENESRYSSSVSCKRQTDISSM